MTLVGRTMQWVLARNEAAIDRARPKGDGPLRTEDFPWTAELETHWREMAAEARALRDRHVTLPEVSAVAGFDQGNEGSWSTCTMYSYGEWIEVQTARCPVTASLVRRIPGLQIAGFAVLGPGAHLPRHRGPNRGALRYQIGLCVPEPVGSSRIQVGSVTHVWTEGGSMVFDHSVEHEAWNDSDGDRFLLFIEFVWPLPGRVGLVNRATQRIFSLAARGLPRRVRELDAALNPGPLSRPAQAGAPPTSSEPTRVPR